jgi:hypothetical protein
MGLLIVIFIGFLGFVLKRSFFVFKDNQSYCHFEDKRLPFKEFLGFSIFIFLEVLE